MAQIFMMSTEAEAAIDDELVPLDNAMLHKESFQYEDPSKSCLKWKLPKVDINSIYSKSRFNFKSILDVSQFESTAQVSSTELKTLDVPLISVTKIREMINRSKREYRYIHIGLVQVGLIPLFNLPADSLVIAAILDKRLIKFKDSLISGVQTNLANGPVWFQVRPNYMMSLSDKWLGNSLTLRIKSTKMNKLNSEVKYLAYHTRIVFKLTKTTTNPRVRNISRVTELFEKRSDNYKRFHRKEINPYELSWPKSWVLTEPTESSRQIGSSQVSQKGEDSILNLEEPMRGFRISDPVLKRTISSRSSFGSNPLDQLPRRCAEIPRTPIEIPGVSLEIPRTSSREDDSQSLGTRRIIGYKEIRIPIYAEDEENQEESVRVKRYATLAPEMVKEIQKVAQQRSVPFQEIGNMVSPIPKIRQSKNMTKKMT